MIDRPGAQPIIAAMTAAKRKAPSGAVLGLLTVAAAAASISLSNVLAPVVYAAGSNPLTLLVFRFAGFVVICGLWLKARGIALRVGRRDLGHCIGAGLAYTIGSGSLVAAFAYVPVSLAVLIFYTFPLITRLAEAALDRRRPRLAELACLVAALAGLSLCLGLGLDRLNGPGLGFSVLAALGVAGSYLWSGRRLGALQPTVMTFHMAGTGLIAVMAVTAASQAWALPPPDLRSIGLMALAALTFAGAFLGMFAGVGMIGPSRTAMVMNLEPVLTVALAVALLDESLTFHQLAGAALVVAAVYLAQMVLPQRPT